MRVLKLGSVGADVANWQRFLARIPIDPGGIDGIFGPRTEAATKQFQRREGLVDDGIVGGIAEETKALSSIVGDSVRAWQVGCGHADAQDLR